MREGLKYVYGGLALIVFAHIFMGLYFIPLGYVPTVPFIIANGIFFTGFGLLIYYWWRYALPEDRRIREKGIDEAIDKFVRDRVQGK